ncbi:eukaryotic aspartyl protease [Ancylostoma ceylanicum]|uniref:Eukaryotic aspartyl protease n=1 Tax=Ancylostoma ceylanicum TaxID=53326 RepID=A0A0D6LSN6_9BILA|nr:eukaryotic aspartyl protease [Ancylostoma ceylanicum]
MKLLLLFAALVAVLYAKTFQMNARSVGSLRARLIASGQYRQYLNLQRMRRIQILRKGSQPFLDYTDDFYVGIVDVGTPEQNVTLVLDTGSSNLWVIDDACRSEACNGFPQSGYTKHKFNTKMSMTFKKEERSFSLFYGSGSCNGYLATDAVSFAGLKILKQEFGVATTIADVFGYQPVDGILGLGWPDLAVEKVKPSAGGTGGLITYGDFDLKNCAKDVTYVKLSSLTYWQFPIQGFSVGNFSQTETEQVISDTGTSWIGAPSSVVDAVAREIGAEFDSYNQLYTVPCSTMKEKPDLVFTIDGVKYNIPSVEYILDLELGNDKCAITFFGMDSGGFGPSWILGDTWIRTYCNIHDIGEKRIGFARAIHEELK